MAARFPHHYEVRVEGGSGGAIVSAAPRPEFRGGPPVEFDGRDDWWSPEHLLLSAAGLCLKTTFEALARRAGVAVIAHGACDGSNIHIVENPSSRLKSPLLLQFCHNPQTTTNVGVKSLATVPVIRNVSVIIR